MQPGTSPFGQFSLSPLPFLYSINGDLSSSSEGFDSSRVLFLASLWLFQGGGPMDLSKVGEKILSSVRSARSLGLLPSTSDRPEVPARAAAAAAVARALAALPPDQRLNLASSSAELCSMYGSKPHGPTVEELEEQFYEEGFDPVIYMLEHIPSGEDELEYYENKATLRLAQLDMISTRLSEHVMEHHEEMVKGMQLVRELERDVKTAAIICMNGRRHLTSSMHEVSRDLIVTTNSKEKQALLDLLPVLGELRNALSMRKELEKLVEAGNFCKAFQVLSEYLQLLDTLSEISAVQEMSRNVEAWLGSTLQKLDSLMLQVCKVFKEEKYMTVVDAYALIGDASGLAEKIQSFFMQEILSETHSALKTSLQEDQDTENLHISSRLTYSDLCLQIPESKFRHCLLRTLAVLFTLMGSYYSIMSFKPEEKVPVPRMQDAPEKPQEVSQRPQEFKELKLASGRCESGVDTDASQATSADRSEFSSTAGEYVTRISSVDSSGSNGVILVDRYNSADQPPDDSAASISGSPWYELRRDATTLVSQALQRGRRNFWQLMTSRVSVLLSSNAFCSTSIHQFLRNYEDLNLFVLAGEAFCGVKASEFRNKLKIACESYYSNYHKQNIYALKMVLERECWQKLPQDAIEIVSFAGLVGDGAPLIASSDVSSANSRLRGDKLLSSGETETRKSGFSDWVESGNPFLLKVSSPMNGHKSSLFADGSATDFHSERPLSKNNNVNHTNGDSTALEDENEDLLADFIDEDSQLPSRVSKASLARNRSSKQRDDETTTQTGSSLCLLRFMDKYARLMQKLGMVNVEFFKGLCQFFQMYYYFVFETFGHQDNHINGKSVGESLSYGLKTALNRISQDCEQWSKPQLLTSSSSSSSPISMNTVPTPTPPGSSFGLKERCIAVDSISLVARILHRSKPHLQLMLLQSNPVIVEDFFVHLVDSVPDLIEHIHRTTARLLLHINGYIDRIANAKWEVKELGMEHNGYVDLLLGEFKHYKTRLAHAGICKEVQDLLLEFGVEIVAETLVEGLSRVKRCTDEGRALMSLDLQVLINGLQHFVPKDVKPKLQIVEAFIKAYYLPETEYVHWARAHPEYNKSQIVGLVNLVATMKGWKRKTRLEILEKIE